MKQKLNLSILILILLSMGTPSLALEFQIHGNNSKTLNAIMAAGVIEWNDVNKLDKFLSTLPHKKHTAIYFDSPGGNLGGGIKLGTYFQQRRIKTVVQGDKICASACALAFLGGTDYKGHKWMSTTTTSRLGFHAFSHANGIRYGETNEIQQTVGEILKYGNSVSAPMEIFIRKFTTPSDEMYWFSTEEALSLGIKVWHMNENCFVGESSCGTKTKTLYKHNKGNIAKINATSFIEKYFNDLKKVPYSQTWNMLSKSMRNKVSLNSYTKWWDTKVDKVVLETTEELKPNVVKARLKYYMKNGKTTCSMDTFILSNNGNNWFIDKQEYKKCPR